MPAFNKQTGAAVAGEAYTETGIKVWFELSKVLGDARIGVATALTSALGNNVNLQTAH